MQGTKAVIKDTGREMPHILVVDNEDVGHFSQRFLDRGFGSLHSASRNSRQFDDKLSTAVFLGYHANLSTVRLDNLIDDGKP